MQADVGQYQASSRGAVSKFVDVLCACKLLMCVLSDCQLTVALVSFQDWMTTPEHHIPQSMSGTLICAAGWRWLLEHLPQ